MGRYKQLNVNIRPDQYSAMLFLKKLKRVPRIAEFVREAIDREVSQQLNDLFVSVVLNKMDSTFDAPIIEQILKFDDGSIKFPVLEKIRAILNEKEAGNHSE